jgi:hypothetical protein
MEAIEKELAQRKLVFIPPNLVEYLEQEKLFGDAVYENFPSARGDIRDAGNCLAAGLNTAAVFHLMRVVELGLRALAKKLHVKKVKKTCQWNLAPGKRSSRPWKRKQTLPFQERQKANENPIFTRGFSLNFELLKMFGEIAPCTRGQIMMNTKRKARSITFARSCRDWQNE